MDVVKFEGMSQPQLLALAFFGMQSPFPVFDENFDLRGLLGVPRLERLDLRADVVAQLGVGFAVVNSKLRMVRGRFFKGGFRVFGLGVCTILCRRQTLTGRLEYSSQSIHQYAAPDRYRVSD